MSSLLPFALPLQRRLTKLYTDTKTSLASVASSAAARGSDAELGALHLKLRIQKDRLVTWGLRWSEAFAEHADIDESLAAAGLADVVASVMGTIKEILAEAEPLWAASSRTAPDKAAAAAAKAPPVVWDARRFEELVKDLTSSIDTLYDISRMRQGAGREPRAEGKRVEVRIEEERAFDKARMETPQAIAPARLRYANGASAAADDEALGATPVMLEGSRAILYLASTSPWMTDGASAPVMLEFAAYDPIYAVTGIAPSMARFERLFAGLRRGPAESAAAGAESGLLNLAGYFDDAENARVGLVYELPARFPAAHLPRSPGSAHHPYHARLADLTAHRALEPPLEAKFRLAYSLAAAVFALHARGVVHGSLAPCNVAFFEQDAGAAGGADWLAAVDVRRPYLAAFDLFPEPAAAAAHAPGSAEPADVAWYRHPLDPRLAPDSPLTPESRSLDLYSLALILVEIGLWRTSQEMGYGGGRAALDVKGDAAAVDRQLAARCGSAYVRAVRACWGAVGDEVGAGARKDVALLRVYGRVLGALERCCGIEEEGEGQGGDGQADFGASDALAGTAKGGEWNAGRSNLLDTRDSLNKLKQSMPPMQPSRADEKKREEAQIDLDIQTLFRKPSPAVLEKAQIAAASAPAAPKAKPRRFPGAAIAQEHLDHWHWTLMPEINHALRGFYRKHAESVEISLESVGEAAHRTRPTILVVCTSVAKVKAVLKRYFAYDAATYGLVVCKGKVVRSRRPRQLRQPGRSMARGDDVPKNPHHQVCPRGGASIGAFAEGQALMPVSLGGVVMVDDELFGLSVHHMLDVPSDSDSDDFSSVPTIRSDAHATPPPAPLTAAALDALGLSLSDSDSAPSSAASTIISSSDSSASSSAAAEPGDVAGIAPDCAAGYLVTQPAFDDVDAAFFPAAADPLADYLAAFTLGPLHASSGLRRATCARGWAHEIDWALFRFGAGRAPGGKQQQGPTRVIPTQELGGQAVRAVARTSGSTRGRILPGLSTVKLRGRRTPSQSWVVEGGVGVPGDSGAWVVGEEGAAGHVLAWSERRRVGYFCPMEVMLEDIRGTLRAGWVGLGGGEVEVDGLEEGMGGLGIGEEVEVGGRGMGRVFGMPGKGELVAGKARGEMEELVAGMEGVCVSTGLVLRGPEGLSGL